MQKPFFPSQETTYREPQKIRDEVGSIAREVGAQRSEIEEIILFGSYATDHPGYFSDLDLLIVVSDDRRAPVERIPDYLLLFQAAPLPVDVFVLTREELNRRKDEGDPFLRGILENGIQIA